MAESLPTFVIIGSQKCGTTALHSYLSRHPEISMSRPKELDYFVAERNWDKGEGWYRDRWQKATEIRGESSPNYTAHPYFAGVPERMAALIPEAKLIFMVRDPIDRVRANWIHAYSNRAESRPIEEAVFDLEMDYLARSRYHDQLTRFLEHYPIERILLLEQEELLNDRRATLARVFGFLGAQEDYWRLAFSEERLESSTRRRRTPLGAYTASKLKMRWWRKVRDLYAFSKPFEQPSLTDELRARLSDELREDAERFRELTGRRFETWSV